MANLRWMVTAVKKGSDNGMSRTLGGGVERLEMAETPGEGVREAENGTTGVIVCAQQTVTIAANAFDVPNLKPDQAEKEETV